MTNTLEIKYNEITGKAIRAAMNTHSFLGCGFLEEIYHKAYFKELKWQNLQVMSKPIIEVYYYDGDLLGIFYPDFIIENKIIIEIKATENICEEYIMQTLNYLKAANIELALLINFGSASLQIKRLVNKHYNQEIPPRFKKITSQNFSV